MLVLSRRETQKILFPSLGISVEVARVKGKTVRLGINAPDEVRIIRSELAEEEPIKLEAGSSSNGYVNNGVPAGEAKAVAKKNLDAAKLAIRLAQNQLRQRLNGYAEEAFVQALDCLGRLESAIALNAEPQSLTIHEAQAGYQVMSRPISLALAADDLDLERQPVDCRPPKRYSVVA